VDSGIIEIHREMGLGNEAINESHPSSITKIKLDILQNGRNYDILRHRRWFESTFMCSAGAETHTIFLLFDNFSEDDDLFI